MKSIFVIIGFLVLTNGCDNSKNKKVIDQSIDASIAGIHIGNPDSAVESVGIEKLNKRKILQPLLLANRDNNEILEIYAHPGDKIYSFSEFKIRKIEDGDEIAGKLVKYNKLTSKKGIKLGMSIDQVQSKLGAATNEKLEGKRVVLEYIVKAEVKSPFLTKHDSPGYFGKYIFYNNELIEAHWGLEQP